METEKRDLPMVPPATCCAEPPKDAAKAEPCCDPGASCCCGPSPSDGCSAKKLLTWGVILAALAIGLYALFAAPTDESAPTTPPTTPPAATEPAR